MGQPKFGRSDNSPKVVRFSKAEAACPVQAKANSPSGAEAQSFEPLADKTPPTGLPTFSSGIRALVAVLVLVALLPNLALGVLLWLGVINVPWSNESPVPAAQSATPPAVLSAPAMLEGAAGEQLNFPIALDGTDGVPARSIIAVRGLPQGSRLSSGRPYDETEWNLKTDEIGDLHLVLPNTASGEAKLVIQLVAPDGAIIADTTTVLKMTAEPNASIGASNIKTELAEAQVSDPRGLEAKDVEERSANLTSATAPAGNPVPLPARRPSPAVPTSRPATANNNVDANWIKLSAFVNLRDGPSPSARVISVIQKGAKLRIIARKNRWVQVSHPGSSERGWIYVANVR